jgi:hypothetical protein
MEVNNFIEFLNTEINIPHIAFNQVDSYIFLKTIADVEHMENKEIFSGWEYYQHLKKRKVVDIPEAIENQIYDAIKNQDCAY